MMNNKHIQNSTGTLDLNNNFISFNTAINSNNNNTLFSNLMAINLMNGLLEPNILNGINFNNLNNNGFLWSKWLPKFWRVTWCKFKFKKEYTHL